MNTNHIFKLRNNYKSRIDDYIIPKGTIFVYDPAYTWNFEKNVWRGDDEYRVCFPHDFITSNPYFFKNISSFSLFFYTE